MRNHKKIILIGAGNVATQLGSALKKSGFEILQVYSRSISSANELAEKLDSDFTNQLDSLNKNADLYIVSVTDNAIEKIAKEVKINNKIIVHTSGTTPMNVLENASGNIGVFYPFQTFSKSKNINFSSVPICIEANSVSNLEVLHKLARQLSEKVAEINSEERKMLHLCGVFACNFSNYLYSIAENILEKNKLDFDIIKSLIKETAEKVQYISPSESQTGPAVRGDIKIINEHLELLEQFPDFKEVYNLLSNHIIKKQNNK